LRYQQMRGLEAFVNQEFWPAIKPYEKGSRCTLRFGANSDIATELSKPFGRQEAFRRLMDFGQQLLETDFSLWPDLVKLYGSHIQAAYLTANILLPFAYHNQCAYDFENSSILFGTFNGDAPWGSFPYIQHENSDLENSKLKTVLDLSQDIILPWPWNMDRYVGCLSHIGRADNPWREDSNHRVIALWPIGIAKVESGNHSLSTGIIRRTGQVHADVVDMRPWLNALHTDGDAFYDRDNHVLSMKPSLWWSALWELSRIVLTNDPHDKAIWNLSANDITLRLSSQT